MRTSAGALGAGAAGPSRDQPLVDAAEPARERRVDRRAEHHRLAVHRAAGRDDQVGARHEALARPAAASARRRRPARARGSVALLRRARQHDVTTPSVAGERAQHAAEDVVREPVVERELRRRAQHREQLAGGANAAGTAGSGSKSASAYSSFSPG